MKCLLLAPLALLAVASAGQAQTSTVYTNDFGTNAHGFTGGTITTAPSGEKFLSFNGAGGSGTLTLNGLAAHSTISLSFSLYAIGSMDGDTSNGSIPGGGNGDYFDVTYAGTNSGSIFHQAFANFGSGEVQSYPTEGSAPGTGAATLNALGYSGFPAAANIQDAEYVFTLSGIADSSGTVSFTFADNSNEGTGNEFYGIDNVNVALGGVTPAVPEPATWAMMIVGMGAVGHAMRRCQRVVARVAYAA